MLPSTITIGSHTFSISINRRPKDECGEFDYKKLTIHVDDRMCPASQESTFAHELIHALTNLAGIGDDEKWTDEEIAARLEYPLYLFLKQNTNFFD